MKKTSKYSLLVTLAAVVSQFSCCQNYIPYYALIDSAELAIMNDDYTKSVEYYSKAFSKQEFVFASDCYKATQSAILAKDTSQAFQFLRLCILQGIQKDELLVSPIFKTLQASSKWQIETSAFDSLRQVYLSRINSALRSRIIPIYEREQTYNEKFDNSSILSYLPNLIQYRRINRECVDSMVQIIKWIGHFPGEQEIGIIDSTMYRFDEKTQQFYHAAKSRPYLNTHEYLMFVHYFEFGGKKKHDELLFKSITDGYLLPECFAFISDNRKHKPLSDFYTVRYKMFKKLKKKSLSEKDKQHLISNLNLNRQRIGLRSLETEVLFQQRILFQRQEWLLGNFNIIYLE